MKERGILPSTDGPLPNVIKIKPPIILSRENADFLLHELDSALS
jgi:4-aminobutyrate aminotransferase-like enzyme